MDGAVFVRYAIDDDVLGQFWNYYWRSCLAFKGLYVSECEYSMFERLQKQIYYIMFISECLFWEMKWL